MKQSPGIQRATVMTLATEISFPWSREADLGIENKKEDIFRGLGYKRKPALRKKLSGGWCRIECAF